MGLARDSSGPFGQRGLWVLVGVVLVGLTGASLAVVGGVGRGAKPPFLGSAQAKPATKPQPRSPSRLRLAGSGSNLPLTRRLAKAFRQSHPGAQVLVDESIGSRGGVLATRDGVIDLGLISRPLEPAEQRMGLVQIRYARVAVVIAANPAVPIDSLDRQGLLALYRGDRATWKGGARVDVIQRERGDSSHRAVNRALPAFTAVNARALEKKRWHVVYRDSAMRDALQATPGAVGLYDLDAIVTQHLPLKVIGFEGMRPSAAHPLPARYPFVKELSFVSRGRPTGLAAAFIAFVRSPAGAALVRRSGDQPGGGPTP